MIVVLLGAPGSGKGTQSKILSEKYGFTHLATGDIFRAEMTAKTALGQKASEYVKSGKLVPDDIVTEMVAGKLDASGGGRYLLDGFPRNLHQAQSLDANLAKQGAAIALVAYLDLTHAEAMRRLTSRRICGGCGESFNVLTRIPSVEGRCDKCGADLIQREDDSEATAAKRLMVFEDLTRPLVAYYKSEQVFHDIDAARAPEDVTKSLCDVIDAAKAAR